MFSRSVHWFALFLFGGISMALGTAAQEKEGWGHRILLEKKPDRFEAHWIDPGPDLHSDTTLGVFYVRKPFTTAHPEAFKRVYVSADCQYILWVNGKEAARGPARFDPGHQGYDTIDLSDLVVKGDNVIVAKIIFWGMETTVVPYFQASARPAFLFDSPELKSDATWRAMASPAFTAAGPENSRGSGTGLWCERVDARLLPAGIEQPGFDDQAWPVARVLSHAEKWMDPVDTWSPWKMYPRSIPAPEVRSPKRCRVIQTGTVKGNQTTPPIPFEVTPDTSPVPDWPVTLPADGKTHYIVIDAGCLVNGFVQVDVDGAAGDALEIVYAEAPSLDFKKDRRDVLENRRIEGSNDSYILRDGIQKYEPFLYRTFRFIRLAAHPTKPMTLRGLSYRWTGYPFPETGQFTCSDENLNQIWKTGWYTQRMCAYDTFMDCPYYERLQYGGDTRIQGLVTLYASGDTKLLANAIRQFQASALPEGLLQSRYPNRTFQVIPGFSLCWIMMLDDYYQLTGDLTLVRESANNLASILMFYERHRTGQGFIANLPYWNFYDWTFEHNGVPDAHTENCTLSTMHYKGTLDIATRLFTALGDDLMAERFRRQAAELTKVVNEKAWDEKEGLYRDGVKTATFSQHVNVFAVLFGFADEAKKKRIAERLFTDKQLRGTTFYFAHYLHDAAIALGKPEYIFDDLKRWQHMLDLGATTWWETPENSRSDCHAWSATPTYRLMMLVLGVVPTRPGFETVRIAPYCGTLTRAEGTVPTPHGLLHVRWERNPSFKMEITVPDGIRAEVVLPDGKTQTVPAGHHTF